MTSSIFIRFASWRVLAGGAAAGLSGNYFFSDSDKNVRAAEARAQFEASYGYEVGGKQLIKPPEGWTGRTFKIRNDYPTVADVQSKGVAVAFKDATPTEKVVAVAEDWPTLPGPDTPIYVKPTDDAPWLNIDFKKRPKDYCRIIKEYCWEGNNPNGREPLNGLTFERPTPAGELAKGQKDLQTWACGFYNEAGASVFGDIWKDPANPKWEKVNFPLGTCVFKVLLSTATKDDLFTMKDAPSLKAVIAPKKATNGETRLNKAEDVRLLQVDFAVRDDRADIGWVFGTFWYDGRMNNKNPWDRLLPVGIMWGNDPELTQEAFENKAKPKQSHIFREANDLRKELGGTRPFWGWNGRMNGPADNFRSACASCHSVSERDHSENISQVPGKHDSPQEVMRYFRNIPSGEPFTKGNVSGDYSLQLMVGYHNYKAWSGTLNSLWHKTKVVIPGTKANKEAKIIESIRQPLRASPEDLKETNEKSA